MSDNSFYVDIHCHPSMKPFYSSKEHSKKKNLWEYIPESKVCNDLPPLIKSQLGEMIRFSQVNLNSCLEGNLKVLFISLYPIERGWFSERKLIDVLTSDELILKSAVCSSGLDKEVVADMREVIDKDREINYFKELVGEYHYINSDQAKSGEADKQFVVVNSYEEMTEIIGNPEDKRIVLIVSIEGGHSLCRFDDFDDLKNTPFRKVNKLNKGELKKYKKIFLENIDVIKGKKYYPIQVDGKEHSVHFGHTPLYITFAHHYWNLLCGHSDSFGLGPDIMLNQGRGKERRFTELGRIVLRKLLHRGHDERRILIDIKHLSVRSRKEFFEIWKSEYDSIGDGFPIISSHTAVNGRPDYSALTLSEENEDDDFAGSFFNTASINMYDPDIKMIHKSNGLIGLILNEARLPGMESRDFLRFNKSKIKKIERKFRKKKISEQERNEQVGVLKNENKQEYLKCLTANIFHIVRVINKKSAWDIISIGSDFDGMIDALDSYTKADQFSTMADDLMGFIENNKGLEEIGLTASEMQRLKFGFSTEMIIKKIMSGNAIHFLQKYFNDSFLKQGIIPRSNKAIV